MSNKMQSPRMLKQEVKNKLFVCMQISGMKPMNSKLQNKKLSKQFIAVDNK